MIELGEIRSGEDWNSLEENNEVRVSRMLDVPDIGPIAHTPDLINHSLYLKDVKHDSFMKVEEEMDFLKTPS